LAAIANAEHAHIHLAGRALIEHGIRAGEALIKAREIVAHGEWIDWATRHVSMHLTTAYRYMRMAEYRDEVLASDARSIEGAIQLLADHPRRGHGPRGYSDADKADWIRLADQIGIKPAARALGVSPSTIHKWTSPNSPSRGQSKQSREVTEDRIERMAGWLVGRFGGYDYPDRITAEVRVDAATALGLVFADPEPPSPALGLVFADPEPPSPTPGLSQTQPTPPTRPTNQTNTATPAIASANRPRPHRRI
jgi:hypothetical protein